MFDEFTNIKVTSNADQSEFIITLSKADSTQQQITFYKSVEEVQQLL
jgi:hypothetical protein